MSEIENRAGIGSQGQSAPAKGAATPTTAGHAKSRDQKLTSWTIVRNEKESRSFSLEEARGQKVPKDERAPRVKVSRSDSPPKSVATEMEASWPL